MSHNKERLFPVALFLIGILTRLPFIERMQSHWDGPNWSIALIRYSFVQQTPSPPGYPLYIAIGKLFHQFVTDPHVAIVMVSVLFGGIGAVVFYYVGKLLFNTTVGVIASLIFLSAPTTIFFGITANPYGVLPTTAAVVAAVVYAILFKKKQLGILLGLSFSFAIGFRPQDTMFLLPLFILGFLFLKMKEKYKTLLSFSLSFFAWFLPTANAVGGISEYFKYVQPFFNNDAKPQISLSRIGNIWYIILRGYYLTLGIGGIFLLLYPKWFLDIIKNKKSSLSSNDVLRIVFFLLWIGPSFLFNFFVRSDHAAHQMTYLSGFVFLIAYAIWRATRRSKAIFYTVVVLVVFFNLFTFFRDRDPENKKPYVSQSYHHSELRKNDIRLSAITSFITNQYDSDNTIILVDPEIFRPITFYLKKYRVYAYGSLDTNISPHIDSVHFGYNWKYQFSEDKTHTLSIPQGVMNVVCITNNKHYVFQADNVRTLRLNGNAFIYSFNTKPYSRYALSVHTIKQIDEKQKLTLWINIFLQKTLLF